MTYYEWLDEQKKRAAQESKAPATGYYAWLDQNRVHSDGATGTNSLATPQQIEQEEGSGLQIFQKPVKGNWVQNVLGTTGDVVVGAAKGILKMGEGVVDLLDYGAAGVADLLGADETADWLRENAKRNAVDENFKAADEYLDQYSVLGRTADSVMEGIGQVGGILLTGGLGSAAGLGTLGTTALTSGTMFLSGAGSGMSEAYQSGATDLQALKHGLNSGAVDAVSEMIFGGLGKGFKALGISKGLSSADDILAKVVSSKVKNQVAKNIVEFGIKSGAEGLEEVIAGVGQAISKSRTYMTDEDIRDILADENLLEQFVVGSLTSGVAQGGGLVSSNISGRDFITGYSQNEQAVVDKEIENRIAEKAKNGKVTAREKTKIAEQVAKDLERGYISTDTIESVLGGESYKKYSSLVEQESSLKKEIEGLENTPESQITVKQRERLNEARKQLEEIDTQAEKNKLFSAVDKLTAKDIKLRESYNEIERARQDFKADFDKYKGTKYEDAAKKTLENAVNAGANNSNRVHDIVDLLANISAKTGETFDFKTADEIKQAYIERQTAEIAKYEAIEDADPDHLAKMKDHLAKVNSGEVKVEGTISGGNIELNIEGSKPLNIVVGHEVTHSVEKAKAFKTLSDHIIKYAKMKGVDTDAKLEALKLRYEGIENADPNRELVADLVGEYLFTDYDYVMSLTTENRNLAQRIYDEVKHLYKLATAGSKEARELERVKKHFEDAFREVDTKNTAQEGGVQYSLREFADGARFVEIDQAQDRFDGHPVEEYPRIAKNIINERFNGKVIGIDNKMFVNGASRDEFANPSKRISDDLYEVKMRTAGELDNLLDAGIPLPNEADGKDGHIHPDAIDFSYFKTLFKIGNRYFDAVINIKNNKRGKLFKDVTKIEDVTQDIMSSYGQSPASQFLRTSSTNSISNPTGNVNNKNVEGENTRDVFGFAVNKDARVDEDLLEELSIHDPNAEVDTEGNVTVYHRTTADNAKKIQQTGIMKAEEDALFFSSKVDGYATDYGDAVVKLKIPSTVLQVNDIFDGEVHFDIPLKYKNGGFQLDVSKYLQNAESGDVVANDIAPAQHSLSSDEDIAPVGGYAFYGKDFAKQTDDIAPVAETAQKAPAGSETADAPMKQPGGGGTMPRITALSDLYNRLKSGEITQAQYDAEVARLNQEGSTGVPTLEEFTKGYQRISVDNEAGISTGEYNGVQFTYEDIPINRDEINDRNAYESYLKAAKEQAEESTSVNTNPALHTPEEQAVIEEYQSAVDDALVDYIETVKANPGAKNGRYTLNDVSDRAAADIKKLTGVDVTGNKTQLEGRIVEHILKDHGEEGVSDHSMRDVKDIARIQYVLDNYDNVEHGGTSGAYVTVKSNGKQGPAQTVVFSKKVNGTYYVVEAVPDTKTKTVFVTSAYMSKNGQKNNTAASQSGDAIAPRVTSKNASENAAVMSGTNVPTNRVPQNSGGVNTDEDIIKTVKERLNAKIENSTEELEQIKLLRDWAKASYDNKIAKLQAEYDTKKNKDTKVAVGLRRRIEKLRRTSADIDVDLQKRISDIEARIAKTSGKLEATPKKDILEVQYERIDKHLEIDKQVLAEEFEKLKVERQKILGDKNSYVSNRAKELYDELRGLRKGVRASNELGYLLDHGFAWDELKSSLINVRHMPNERVNHNSVVESVVRRALEEEYNDRLYELNDMDSEYARQVEELETEAERQKDAARRSHERMTRKTLYEGIMERIRSGLAELGFDLNEMLKGAKNLSTFAAVDNTPQRVNEKTFGYKAGQALNDLTVNKAALNESDGIKWLNGQVEKIRNISKRHGIKPGSKESKAAQIYGEGFWVNEAGEYIQYGDAELVADFPDTEKRAKIKALAQSKEVRQMYDETLEAINAARVRNGYPPIPRLDNYFLHYRAMDDTFSKLGLPFNPNDVRAKDLPTDLNGVTADLKPGKPFFASEMHREGDKTTYDLLGGLERYMNSAKNQIYHIDDIQTFRALRNYIADMFGQANGLADLDNLSIEEQEQRIKEVFDNHLSTYAKFLNEEANIFAGKTALIDRGVEGVLGRRAIQFLHDVNGQVGKNMVGWNVSSAGTNILPVVQATARLPMADMVKAFAQTIANKFHNDGFVENDPALIRRKGADQFAKTPWQKISDPGYILMSAVDNLSSELIVRAKYNELTRKGMDSQQAHIRAGEWAMRLMGDRSIGQMPQLYNSKTLGLITKFQLEVRNQLDAMGYDVIQEAKADEGLSSARKAGKVALTMAQLAIFQHIFGKAYESVAGYNPAFDIVENIIKLFGWDDDEEDEDTFGDNAEQAFLGLLEDLPYTSTFTGGRIPIASALPVQELITGKDSYGNEKSRLKTAAEAAPYYLLPGGYGQIKKTAAGMAMFSDDLPIAGSYTDSGNLRFPVEDTFGNRVQAALFGQYASKNARDYFDNERSPLKEKQIQEFVDVDLPIADYWKYREGLAKQETAEEKFDYIAGLDLPVAKKNVLINNALNRKEQVNMDGAEDFSSLEEFDFATKKPGQYAVSQAVGDYKTYSSYTDHINDLGADKDKNGKAISGSKKQKVIAYIESLPLDYGQKCILFKSQYKSDNSLNKDIIEYLDSREDIDYDEMVTILKELGFTVNGNNVYWD